MTWPTAKPARDLVPGDVVLESRSGRDGVSRDVHLTVQRVHADGRFVHYELADGDIRTLAPSVPVDLSPTWQTYSGSQ